MGETIRVLIADDHPLIVHGVRKILDAAAEISLVGEASRGDDAQRLCQELMPDVLLLDLQMPGATATETVAFVRAMCPQTQVVILTAYDDDVYVHRMLGAGIAAYVLKDEVAEGVVTAIRTVMQGGTWLSRRVLETLMTQHSSTEEKAVESHPKDAHSRVAAVETMISPLTRQQTQVLRLVEDGLTNDEIADRLSRSSGTVKKHLDEIFSRLGVHHRDAAARTARERGYLD
jgi:DNA-binding NarL/FixJ family response regulator